MIPFKPYLIAGAIMVSLVGYGWYEHTRFLNLKIEYQDFIENALALQLKKEKEHAIQVNVAMGMRDDAIRRMYNNQIRINTLQRTIAAQGDSRVCYDAAQLNGSYGILVAGLRELARESEGKAIDLKAAIDSWPK